MRNVRRAGHGARGASMLVAILLVLVLAVVATAVLRWAGSDRISSARMGTQERGLSCAEMGIQYGRRFFGCSYKRTNGWNDFLGGAAPGRFDPSIGDAAPADLDDLPLTMRGDGDNDGKLDPESDLNGDGVPDFWVSIRDDDDERPNGAPDDRTRDNNLSVILHAECTTSYLSSEVGGQNTARVLEAVMTYVPGHSEYGSAPSSSNAPEASTTGSWVSLTVGNCD